MSTVQMKLGPVRFSIATAAWETLRRVHGYNWAEVKRMGRAPALQYVGPGGARITLEGTIYPGYRGEGGTLDDLRAAAAEGKPLSLMDGTGIAWGQYVIERVEDTGSHPHADGRPRKHRFVVGLREYGEDGP